MAYDPVRRLTVLYGGYDGDTALWDCWLWNGEEWLEVDSTPTARRVDHELEYDSVRQRIVSFGGSGMTHSEWPWGEWNGHDWQQIDRAVMPSTPRWATAIVNDTARGRIVLYGGQTEEEPYKYDFPGDTWEWDGDRWQQQHPQFSPPRRSQHGMAYDSARERTVLFGGRGQMAPYNGALADTWEWDGENWEHMESIQTPPARSGHAMAYDSARQRTVLFGGFRSAKQLQDRALGDTWEWDGRQWTEIKAKTSPPPRWGAEMVYDVERQRIALFGGHVGYATPPGTWEWDGRSWTLRAQPLFSQNVGALRKEQENPNYQVVRDSSSYGLDPELIRELRTRALDTAEQLRQMLATVEPKTLEEQIQYFELLLRLERNEAMAVILEERKAFYSHGSHSDPDYGYLLQQFEEARGQLVSVVYPLSRKRFAAAEEADRKLSELKKLQAAITAFNNLPMAERVDRYSDGIKAKAILERGEANAEDVSHEEMVWAHQRNLSFYVNPDTFLAEAPEIR